MRLAPLIVLALALAGCDEPTPSDLGGTGARWAAADQAFHREPRWLGGDAVYSVDLGDARTLWLFGDSFIATSPALSRTASTMVRNSVAVMTGTDLLTASMEFAWRDGAPPTSFFPERGDRWSWPGGGVRGPDGSLLVFLSELRATPGEGLGFAVAGWRAVRVADPSGPPSAWTITDALTAPAPGGDDTIVGACVAVDGDHLVALAIDDGDHDGRLVRWPLATIATGDLRAAAWWDGTAWVEQAALTATPPVVLPDAPTECSLHRDAASGRWVHTASRGFGATTLAIRTAARLEGPWSGPTDVFTPPESSVDDAFVYAGKAHPHLRGPTGGVVATYADNSFTFADLFDPARADTLYWPHVAELTLTPR